MAVVKTKSTIFAKLGPKVRAVHQEAVKQPVNLGNPSLPAGIENGIAELESLKFGVYKEGPNKGKDFFIAAGVVKSPTEHDGVPIFGMLTRIGPIPFCDTKNKKGEVTAWDKHYKKFLDVLRGLDPDTDFGSMDPETELEPYVAELSNTPGIRFKFRTWKGKKQTTGEYAGIEPQVQHQWNGVIREGENGAANGVLPPSASMDDQTGDGEEPNADGAQDDQKTTTVDEGDVDSVETVLDPNVSDSVAELGIMADGGDEDAQNALWARAEAAGIDTSEDWNAVGWAGVAAEVERLESGVEEPTVEPEPPAEPAKGEKWVYSVKTKGPMGKMMTGKPAIYTVTSVNKTKKTVQLTHTGTNKLLVDSDKKPIQVPFDELSREG